MPKYQNYNKNKMELLKDQIFDVISTIRDPEKPLTLEELEVVQEDLITVRRGENGEYTNVIIKWVPTVPH